MKTNYHDLMRQIFYALLVRPFLLLALGLNVRHLDRLKVREGHLIVANHNSHLDALALMSLFKLHDIPKVKLVAAKDYFCRTPLLTWLSLHVLGIIPIDRQGGNSDPLAPVILALHQGYTVIMFPEGSRGEPEKIQPLKYGIAKILQQNPDISVTPIFMHGLGKSLPRGEALLVPFICEINIGDPLKWEGDRAGFIFSLERKLSELSQEISPKAWN